jgi:hypothetical protein
MSKISKYIVISFIVLLGGCGLFQTRNSENPVQPRSNFIPPTSPDLVLVNLQSAISDKDLNNYMQCFVDSTFSNRRYNYIPDVLSQGQYPIFRNWQLYNERIYFNNLLLLTTSQSTSLLFFANSTLTEAVDTAVFDADYLLRVDHQKPNVAKTITGKLRLVMSVDSRNLWAIHSWMDIKSNTSDTTWSVLRANFSY